MSITLFQDQQSCKYGVIQLANIWNKSMNLLLVLGTSDHGAINKKY